MIILRIEYADEIIYNKESIYFSRKHNLPPFFPFTND